MKKTILCWLLILLLLLIGCREKESSFSPVQRPLVTGVTVVRISPSLIDSFYETSGTVKAGTVSVISSRTVGTVVALKAREGDRVKAGDPLVVLDERELTEKVSQAEAAARESLKALESAEQNKSLAEVTYRRYKNLYAEMVITQQEMDQIENQMKLAEAEYGRIKETVTRTGAAADEAKIYRGYSRIKAPVSGVITEKKIDPGNLALPGMPLLTIEDQSQLKVEAYVNERLAPKLKKGAPVYILLETTGQRIPAAIGEIIPAIDPASRTFLIKIPLKDPGLKSGLYCRVQIPEGKQEILLVPKRAVVERGQLTGVFVVDDQKVMTFRLVRTGKDYGDRVEILSGLKGQEQVAIEGLERALDGGRVEP